MTSIKETKYYCDKCNETLNSYRNSLNIRTSLSEKSYWKRLHIVIKHISGVHNDSETRDAELCKKCAIELLKDAIKRVISGERMSAGVENIEMGKWS